MVDRGERGNHAEGAEKTLKTLRFPREFCELRVQAHLWGDGNLSEIFYISRITLIRSLAHTSSRKIGLTNLGHTPRVPRAPRARAPRTVAPRGANVV